MRFPRWTPALAGVVLIGSGLLTLPPAAEARPGATAPAKTRPRSVSVRSQRSTAPKPVSAAANQNASARAQRVASARSRGGSVSSRGPRAVTRPRSQAGSMSGSSRRASARRTSVRSVTGSYRSATAAGNAAEIRALKSQVRELTRLVRDLAQGSMTTVHNVPAATGPISFRTVGPPPAFYSDIFSRASVQLSSPSPR